MKRLIFLLSFVLCSVMVIDAQIKITGSIKDQSTGNAMEYVQVKLLTSDSVYVTGAITDDQGIFVLNNISANKDYMFITSSLGYKDLYQSIPSSKTDITLPPILCVPTSAELDAVTVTANPVINKLDKQIILPTQNQIAISSNGVNLLRNLQISRLIISPIDNSIQLAGGDAVQLRINDVEVSKSEIVALNPKDIVKVEYIDNPGLRYNNAAAVVNFVTRQKVSGGSISVDLSNGLSKTKFGENNISSKYNNGKSEFSANGQWSRRDLGWVSENNEIFKLPTGTIERQENGNPTKVKFEDIDLSLNYNLQSTDKYQLNVRLRNNHNNTPNDFSDRESSILQGDGKQLDILDHAHSRENTPILDVYYFQQLKNNQDLIFNVVGTYMDTKSNRIYQESRNNNVLTDIHSNIEGRKHSLITEGIYEKQFKDIKLSTGIRHSQAYTKNEYTGDVLQTTNMRTAQTFAYFELSFAYKKMKYRVGAGEMRTYNSQAGISSDKYIFRPTLSISYQATKEWFVRYNAYLSGYAPSLSALNDVQQSIDSIQIRRGNPNLKTVTYYSNTLTSNWKKGIVGVDLFLRYSYDHKPIMESTFVENESIVRMMKNQKGLHRINSRLTVNLQPFGDYLSIQLAPFFNRYISQGEDYTQTLSNWGFSGNLVASYKKWSLNAMMNTHYDNLLGEVWDQGESFHMVSAGYNAERWNLSLGMMFPFSNQYELKTTNRSDIAYSQQYKYSSNFGQLLVLSFSMNLNFGRNYSSKNRQTDNSDTDSGILSGKK